MPPQIIFPHRLVARLGLLACAILIGLPSAGAQLPVIGLRSLSQSFFAPGGQYEISIAEGNETIEVRELAFSHPGIKATLLDGPAKPFETTPEPRYGSFRIDVAPDVPEGRYEVRAIGRFGISNPRSVLVQNETQTVTSAGNDATTASPLTLGTLHWYKATAQKRDTYSIPFDAGKRYALNVISHSIDSRLIPAISVINEKGQTIASAIGSDQSDLRFVIEASQTGPVTITIHDALFRGGAAFQYGLRLTEDTQGQRYDPAQLANAVSIPEGSVPPAGVSQVAESDAAVALEFPAAVEANFDSPEDQDQYLCKFQKGKPVVIEVVSDRIGQPTDVRLLVDRGIDDAAGARTWQRVATAEDSHNLSDSVIRLGSGDPVLNFQPPEDGEYRITVADLDTGQSLGDVQRYQLRITPPTDQLQLLAYHVYPHKDVNATRPSGVHLPRAGSTTFRVFAIRNAIAGPIKVSIANLPAGLQSAPAWIAANQNQTDLIVTASADVKTQWAALQIVGEINRDGQTITREAQAAAVVWEQDGYRPIQHSRLIDSLAISSTELDVHPITIGPASPDPVTAMKGTKATVSIKLSRQEGANQNVVLRAKNLPPGVTAGDLTIAGDKSEADWTVDVTGNATPGTYTFWGQGETKVKFAVNPQSLTHATKSLEDLKALRADPNRSQDHAELDKAIAAANTQLEAIKKQTAARDFTLYVPSALITLVIQ